MNNEETHPKRTPTGIYDRTILCAGCEPLFGPWDQYAQDVLTDNPPGQPQKVGDRIVGYEVTGPWRYDLVKLFFVSLAWRASVSTHSFYARVRLGRYEEQAKAMLKETRPGDPQEFAVTLARFADPIGKAVLDPHPEKIEGVNYVRFYLAGYVAYVKVDRRPAPQFMSTFVLAPGGPLKLIGREFMQSQEFQLAKSIVARQQSLKRKRAL